MPVDPLKHNPDELQFDVPFTQYLRSNGQYLRSNGRTRPVRFSVQGDLALIAKAVIDKGLRFEVEELRTGHASLTINDPGVDRDVAIEVVPNGPEVDAAVERLIRSGKKYLDQYEEQHNDTPA